MDHDPREEELDSLRLALATFALRLDAFEARLKVQGGPTNTDAAASKTSGHIDASSDLSDQPQRKLTCR